MLNQIKQSYEKISASTNYRSLKQYYPLEGKLIASSNDYLGLSQDRRVIEAAREAVEHYGTSSTGSRLTTGNLPLHEQLENELAHFKNTEACLLFSSGYLANLAAISTLADQQTIIFSDEYNHASIIDACRLSKSKLIIYAHNDPHDLREKISAYKYYPKKLIVTDGVFSMDGDLAKLDELAQIKDSYRALLLVDDAHGTGVIGSQGRGSQEYFGIQPDLIVGSLSKALASEGGFICASRLLIHYFIQRARPFIFQTALSPANLAAALASLDLLQKEQGQRKLLQMSMELRRFLQEENFRVPDGITPILPIILGEEGIALEAQERLYEEGIIIPAIRPPTVPVNTSRLRCTLKANFTEQDIDRIKQAFLKIKPG